MLVKVLHTFSSKQEGKRVHKDSILDLPEVRVKALMHATPGRPLVRPLRTDEIAAHKGEPLAKVEPDSRPPARAPRQAPGTAGKNPPSPRGPSQARTRDGETKAQKARKALQAAEPEFPRPLARGAAGRAAPAVSSSPEAPAPGATITRQRGTRSPKQSGSRSTTPGA